MSSYTYRRAGQIERQGHKINHYAQSCNHAARAKTLAFFSVFIPLVIWCAGLSQYDPGNRTLIGTATGFGLLISVWTTYHIARYFELSRSFLLLGLLFIPGWLITLLLGRLTEIRRRDASAEKKNRASLSHNPHGQNPVTNKPLPARKLKSRSQQKAQSSLKATASPPAESMDWVVTDPDPKS